MPSPDSSSSDTRSPNATDATTAGQARALLHRLAGPTAEFHTDQLEAIEALVDERRRVLVVQRTGWGKSAVYFLATRLLRDQGSGPTLLISPLLALMRNQIEAAERIGLRAASLNSANTDEWDVVEQEILGDGVDVLLISPERLNNPRFRANVLPHLVATVGLLVIDEVHCISDWGHDFRPDYRRLARVLDRLPRGVPVLGCTATANDRVVADVEEQLGEGAVEIRGGLDRASLELEVIDLPSQAERMAWLATEVPAMEGTGIVYCLTIADAQRVAAWLRSRGLSVLSYTGATEPGERLVAEEALRSNEVKALVATSALGMGYDKPDLGFVVHYQGPGSPIAYYQQVGRAGRALDRARVVLLRGHEDADIQDYFIRTAFPPREQAEQVITLLEDAGGPVKITEIEAEVNVRRSRLEGMLKILDAEGAVERVGSAWQRTLVPWSYDDERVERVTTARRAEQAAMARYGTDGTCLMRFLRAELDDPVDTDCGRCSVCRGQSSAEAGAALTFDVDLVEAARTFLRSSPLSIEPRRQWPRDVEALSGNIPKDRRLLDGRALSVLGDAGWGDLVKQARVAGEPYDDRLVQGAVQAIAGTWRPDPAPAWITTVPGAGPAASLLVDFAERLAGALDLRFVPALTLTRAIEPQAHMHNSAQQVGNLWGAYAPTADVPPGPVLLVDDLVDSRWTLTVAGAALLEAGSGPVLPFALAKAGGD
ncbi:MAG: ATP-dependent DNA helicase RecQ [Acidimicrobiales bacterium]|nr:ATP-dependent DNA helicase RecQ [Acidimicrobiales bacterium]